MERYYAQVLYDEEFRKIRNECYQEGIIIENISPAGSLRRGKLSIGDIDLVINTNNNELFREKVIPNLSYRSVCRGSFFKKDLYKSNVDMFLAEKFDFYSMLFFLTGSEDWNIRIMTYLKKNTDIRYTPFKFVKVSENNYENLCFSSEEEIFRTIGLKYKEPKDRKPQNVEFI